MFRLPRLAAGHVLLLCLWIPLHVIGCYTRRGFSLATELSGYASACQQPLYLSFIMLYRRCSTCTTSTPAVLLNALMYFYFVASRNFTVCITPFALSTWLSPSDGTNACTAVPLHQPYALRLQQPAFTYVAIFQ